MPSQAKAKRRRFPRNTQALKPKAMRMAYQILNQLQGYHSLSSLRAAGLQVGSGVTLGAHTYVDKKYAWAIAIGDDTTISWNVSIMAHDAAGWHHTGFTEIRPVRIGARAYIGAGCLVLPGSSVGDGTIIGAGSLVHGEIPADVVAAGIPCRVISSVTDYVERYRANAASAPHIDKERAAMTAEDIAHAQRAIADHGHVFIR